MTDNQQQEVATNGQAIQAARDVIINDYVQIREICNDLFKLNFPALVSEATEKAKLNLKEYAESFVKSIQEDEREKIQEKLKTPRAQYLLNQSINNAARFGNQIDFELLSRSEKNALSTDDDFLEMVFSEASEIIPRLNRKQLILILVNFYISGLGFKEEVVNPLFLEMITTVLFADKIPIAETNISHRMHLVTLGLWTFNQFAGGSANDMLVQRYPNKFNTIILPAMQSGLMPNMSQIALYYTSNNMVQFNLTPTGAAIAYLLIKEKIPLDPSILKNI